MTESWTPKPGTQVYLSSLHFASTPGKPGGRFLNPSEVGLYDVLESGRLVRAKDGYELVVTDISERPSE